MYKKFVYGSNLKYSRPLVKQCQTKFIKQDIAMLVSKSAFKHERQEHAALKETITTWGLVELTTNVPVYFARECK